MPATIGQLPVITADVTMPVIGAWHARFQASGATALTGAVVLSIEGVAFAGTVTDPCNAENGRVKGRIVGGAGKLVTELKAKNYPSGPKVSTIIADIMRESGETLSSTADSTTLGKRVPKWERSKGSASQALVRIAKSVGAIWRVLRDGTIWIGPEAYPSTTVEHQLIDESFDEGLITLGYPEGDGPSLTPGVTFRGQPIRHVKHSVTSESLRTEARLESPGNLLERFLAGVYREINYSRLYPARVALQNPDGTLQVVPDDEILKAGGLDKVPYRLGVPGTVEVTKGQRVLLGFEGGDPQRPVAICWHNEDMTMLRLGNAEQLVALAPLVDSYFQTLHAWATTFVVPTGLGPSGNAVPALQQPQSVACSKVMAE